MGYKWLKHYTPETSIEPLTKHTFKVVLGEGQCVKCLSIDDVKKDLELANQKVRQLQCILQKMYKIEG